MLAVVGFLLSLEALAIASWGLVRLHRKRDAKRRRWVLMLVTLLLVIAAIAVLVRFYMPAPYVTPVTEAAAVGGAAGLGAIALFLTWYLGVRVLFEWPAHKQLTEAKEARARGDLGKAIECWMAALPALRRGRNRRLELTVLSDLGRAHIVRGEPDRAGYTFDEALNRARGFNNPELVAHALIELGLAQIEEERLPAASATLQQAVEAARKAKNKTRTAQALYGLAWLAYTEGDFDRCSAELNRAAAASPNEEDPEFRVNMLGLTGRLALREGNLNGAKGAFDEALRMTREMQDPERESLLEFSLGVRDYVDGWHDTGMERIQGPLVKLRRPGRRLLAARWLLALSWLARQRQRVVDAESLAGAALQMAGDNEDLTALSAYCKDPDSAPDLAKAAELNAAILDRKAAQLGAVPAGRIL
jgi:tetratricopeptide (TPR) repeat protein